MSCQNFNNLIKFCNFLRFIEIWLMFPPFPMYETNAIQLHFLVRFFWYLSLWSGLICSIFCTRLYSKDIHCEVKAKQNVVENSLILAYFFLNSSVWQVRTGTQFVFRLTRDPTGKMYVKDCLLSLVTPCTVIYLRHLNLRDKFYFLEKSKIKRPRFPTFKP